MATSNKAAQVKQILKVLRKHFKGQTAAPKLPVLEHAVYACCLENSSIEQADKAFATLKELYFDWNEVRVSSIRELGEALKGLTDPVQAGSRVKRTLQSVFEAYYSFDIDSLTRENIGQAVKKLERFDGTTRFTVAYITQVALGGHAIPVNDGLMLAFQTLGLITESEASKGLTPGLERAIPKNKGYEAFTILHQLGVLIGRNPYAPAARKLLLEIDPDCKDNLPKRPKPPPEPVPEPPPKKPAKAGPGGAAKKLTKKPPPAQKPAAPKKAVKKSAKKPPPRPIKKKSTPTKKKKAASSRTIARKKPR